MTKECSFGVYILVFIPCEVNETILKTVELSDCLYFQYGNPRWLPKQLKINNNKVLVIAKLINIVKIATKGFSTDLISIGCQY